MAELAKKLHFKKDGVEQTGKAYSTTAEAGAEYIPNKIDDVTCYVAIGNTTDNRATVGRVKKSNTAAERAILSTGKPPYTEQSWTTAGTYTWTCPQGVSRIRLAVCGGGGGVAYCGADSRDATAGTGGKSAFDSLISATGGTGGTFSIQSHWQGSDQEDTYTGSSSAGLGGNPNGTNGTSIFQSGSKFNTVFTSAGGTGFSLSFNKTITLGGYGNGGYARIETGYSGSPIANAGGGSGGYNTGYFAVSAGKTYSIIVGGAGSNVAGSTYQLSVTVTTARTGFVLIAFGGDI